MDDGLFVFEVFKPIGRELDDIRVKTMTNLKVFLGFDMNPNCFDPIESQI